MRYGSYGRGRKRGGSRRRRRSRVKKTYSMPRGGYRL